MSEVHQSVPLGVIIADTQSIYRVGIRKIVALEPDLKVLGQTDSLGNKIAGGAE